MAAPPKNDQSTPALAPCAALLRRGDRDRFLICQFAEPSAREDLFALYAFNLEIAKTLEMVSEPMLGQIRLQWWRDTLTEIADGRVRRHEVVEPLAAAIARRALPLATLGRLIDARETDLEPGPPATIAAFEAYCVESSAVLVELAMRIVGGDAGAAARAIGVAHAIAGLLTAVPKRVGEGRLDIPAELLPNETADAIRQRGGAPSLPAGVEALAGRATALLDGAEAWRLAGSHRAPLLIGVAARRMLKRLGRAGWNPFDPALALPDPWIVPRLTWARLTGRI